MAAHDLVQWLWQATCASTAALLLIALLRHPLRRAFGARVAYAECYRRVPPRQPDAAALARLRQGEIDILVITSAEGARNLCNLVGESGRARLLATAVVVVSGRQAQACRELGYHAELCVATQTSDAAILDALRAWRARQNSL